MKKVEIIQRLQTSPLTRWIWIWWQHEDTGRLIMLPFWKVPPRPSWRRVRVKFVE